MKKLSFETTPTYDFTLQNGRVDVWEFSLKDEPEWAFPLLDQAEQTRANRYHFPRHRRRFTVARALLRMILARYMNCDPKKIELLTHQHGKPYINTFTDLKFNLSHSKDSALLGIGVHDELGIDLEHFSERPFVGIANHVFSPQEVLAVVNANAQQQTLTFFNIWAQKEAFIKAVGMGLAYPLQQFDVATVPQTECEVSDLFTQKTWRLLSFMATPSCCAALCITPKITQLRRTHLKSVQELNRIYEQCQHLSQN